MGNNTENGNIIAVKKTFFKFLGFLFPIVLAILSNQIKTSINTFENSGLDSSWAWSLNYFFENSYIFGRDVVFTYGPLGWLLYSSGKTVDITCCFWVVMIFITAYVLYESLIKTALKNRQWFKFSIFTLTFLYAFFCNKCSPEYFILYLYCLTVLTFVFISSSKFLLVIASLLLTTSFFMKFSLVIQIIAFVTTLAMLLLIFKNKHYKALLLHIFLSFTLCCVIYLVFYSHSINDLVNYFVGSINQAIGYNWAMSIGEGHRYTKFLSIAIFYLLIFVIIAFFNIKDERNLPLIFSILSVLFFMYKHGFVRGDGHVYIFFNTIVPFLGLFLLFFRYPKQTLSFTLNIGNLSIVKKDIVDCIIIIMIVVSLVLLKHFNAFHDIKNSLDYKLSNYSNYIEHAKKQKASQNADLPHSFTERIKNKPVSIYPIDLLYARNQKINFVPLYPVQAYSGYTTWLDEKSSEKFSIKKGPEYVIFNRDTIDNRFPFIEMPMTYLTFLRNYFIDYYDRTKDLFLLKKRSVPLFLDESIIYKKTEKFIISDPIQINDISNNLMLKLNVKYSLWGRFINFIYKTPSVDMILTYDDGTKVQRRIILQNLVNGFIVSSIPNSSLDLIEIFNNNRPQKHVTSIQFTGPGLMFFSNIASVDFYTVKLPLQNIPLSLDLDRVETIKADSIVINDIPIKIDNNFCIDEYFINERNIFLRGWIFNKENGNPFKEIYLKIGDLLYKLGQYPRQDVVDHFKLKSVNNHIGFYIFSEYLYDNKLNINELVFVVRKDNDNKYYYLAK